MIPLLNVDHDMKPEHTRKLLGGFAALAGVCWILGVAVPPITRIISDGSDASSIPFPLMMVPLMAIPGVLAVVFGVRLFQEMQESSLKWVVGVFSVFFAFFLSSSAEDAFPPVLPGRVEHSAYLLAASLIAVFAYLAVLRLLVRYFTGEDRRFSSFLGRGALALMAWQVWILLSGIFAEYSPSRGGSAQISGELWSVLSLVVPIAVPFGLYRFFAWRLIKA
jgi:hypothetical protein